MPRSGVCCRRRSSDGSALNPLVAGSLIVPAINNGLHVLLVAPQSASALGRSGMSVQRAMVYPVELIDNLDGLSPRCVQ